MNTRKVDKREQHVRKKLTAAILMLLISCIMTVTSTYAWFTLSTAPEVTGIQTTIGGNGNLEIALANGITWLDTTKVDTLSSTDGLSIQQKNITWGNLIDVSTGYGVDKISLSPAAILGSSKKITITNLLQAPKYGSDGRVSGLEPAMFATYDTTYNNNNGAFVVTESTLDDYGFRAIGISTARTERQSSFAAAKALISTSMNNAQLGTSNALANNGNALGNLAVKVALSDKPKFSKDEVGAIKSLINDTQSAVALIEDAIISLIDAAAASAQAQGDANHPISDADYLLINAVLKNATIKDTFVLDDSAKTVTISYGEGGTFTVNDSNFYSLLVKYNAIVDGLAEAKAGIPDKDSYEWSDISTSVSKMMNMQSKDLTVGGYDLDTLKADPGKYASDIIQKPVVELGPDSGLFADIASLVGTVKASILLDISAASITVQTNATISATNENPLISVAATAFSMPSSAGSDEANEISDIYGFALDLLFRTNAENSDLLLQTTPKDRIYGNNSNEETLGKGSTMTFTKSTSTFSDEAMLSLMNGIKIVFIDQTGNVLGNAGLDTGYTFEKASNTEVPTHALLSDGKTYALAEYVSTTGEDNTVTYSKATTGQVAQFAKDGETYTKAEYVKKTNYKVSNGSITVDIRILSADGSLITENTTVPKTVYEEVESGGIYAKLSDGTYAPATHKVNDAGTYEPAETGATHALDTDNVTPVEAKYVAKTTNESVDPTITSLTQNVVSQVTVLVYLDGNVVDNSDVANAATSMTGTMNLQFASSAELKPMEYSGLHIVEPTATPDSNNP